MKYFLFAFHLHNEWGGFGDFKGVFDSEEDAREAFKPLLAEGLEQGEIARWDGQSLVLHSEYLSWDQARRVSVEPDWYPVSTSNG